jgi:putative peptidoglycan binding protein
MKSILYSVCIGILALTLTAAGAQAATDKDKRSERAKPQQRSANVQAARPANTGRIMSSHRNVSAAQNRQQSPRTSSAVNRAARPALATPATVRARRDIAAKTPTARRASETRATARDRNSSVNRNRNVAVNRDRNVAVNRTARPASATPATADVNRVRNANEFRGRNNVAINRNRNFAVNRTQNAAYYRGGNVRITNNWHGDAFRGQRYAAFRNYQRQWHDRSWWRRHYDRIVFVNNGWWYWNAGYWFPAWGYAPSVSFVFDGPIYGYNGLPPDQVTVNVQEQLARAGYYDGPIDGVLGPMTREAIAAYQADNGLAVTSAIDEPTLAAMGLV